MVPMKGIGFTVAIFISILAFDDAALQAPAALAILVASLLAGLIGVGSLRRRLLGSGGTRPVAERSAGLYPPSCRRAASARRSSPAVALLAGGMIKA